MKDYYLKLSINIEDINSNIIKSYIHIIDLPNKRFHRNDIIRLSQLLNNIIKEVNKGKLDGN